MELLKLNVSDIEESATNPRKDFDKADLAVLAESIKATGQLVPIIVREKGKGYVLVAGARRLRAHVLADLKVIDALLMEADDLRAEEAQLVENDDGKRIPLSPLEKAEGYAGFMKRHKLTVDELALRIKVSRSNVYATVRLNTLHPDAKKALKDGVLKESTAKVLAQVHSKRQAEATKDVLKGLYNAGPMTVRQAVHHLQQKYFLDLRKALFDTTDPELDKEAGPCTSCEKRTGAQPELALEEGATLEPDQCTDAPCWATKTGLHAVATAEKKGVELLDAKEAAKVFNQYDDLQPGSEYVLADRPHPGSSADQKYSDLLTPEQKKTHMVLALTPRGDVVELIKNDGLAKAIEEAGRLKKRKAAKSAKSGATSTRSSPAAKKQTPEEKAKAEFEEKIRVKLNGALFTALISGVEKEGASKKALSAVARLAFKSADIDLDRRGVKQGAYRLADDEKAFAKAFGKYSSAQLVGLIYEASLGYELEDFLEGHDGGEFDEQFLAFGVDRKKVEAAVRAATPLPPELLAKVADTIEAVATESLGKKDGKKVAGKFRKTLKLKKPVKAKAAKKSGAKKKAA